MRSPPHRRPIQVVAASADAAALDFEAEDAAAFVDHGVCVGSGEGFDGLKTAKAKKAVIAKLAEEGKGLAKISFKLRDWVFSRQRYWGEPIPIYFPVKVEAEGGDPRNGDAHVIDFDTPIAVDEADLPVKLPDIDDFKPGKDPQVRISPSVPAFPRRVLRARAGTPQRASRPSSLLHRRACWPRPSSPTGATSKRTASGMRARRTRCRSGQAAAGTTCASRT